MTLSTISGGASIAPSEKTQRPTIEFQISPRFLFIAYFCLITWILTLIAFSSPYWLASYEYSNSKFIRLGLWEFCFRDYRHSPRQLDEKFDGCSWVFSAKFQNIRDWLQPIWFIFVQIFATFSFVFSILSLMVISLNVMHYMIRYRIVFIAIISAFEALSGLTLGLATFIFGLSSSSIEWIQYPRFNYMSYSFYLSLLASILHSIAAYLMFTEISNEKIRKKKLIYALYNMEPRHNMSSENFNESRPMMNEGSQRQPFKPLFTQV